MRRPILTFVVPAILFAACVPVSVQAATRRVHPSRDTQPAAASVQIVETSLPAGASSVDIGPSRWSVQGVDLPTLLAQVYGIDGSRIDLGPASEWTAGGGGAQVRLASTTQAADRFDISLPLSGSESDEEIQAALRRAIEARFHLQLRFELRTVDAYVLTAPHGPGAGLHPLAASLRRASESLDEMPMAVTVSGQLCPDISTIAISAHAATLAALAGALEDNLGRPVVDETHLASRYDFHLSKSSTKEELLSRLESELGITVTQAPRAVEVLTVRPLPASGLQLRAAL